MIGGISITTEKDKNNVENQDAELGLDPDGGFNKEHLCVIRKKLAQNLHVEESVVADMLNSMLSLQQLVIDNEMLRHVTSMNKFVRKMSELKFPPTLITLIRNGVVLSIIYNQLLLLKGDNAKGQTTDLIDKLITVIKDDSESCAVTYHMNNNPK